MPAHVYDTSFFSRRAVALVGIVAFHILVIYVMASGLAQRVVEVIAPPIKTDIIEEVEKRDEPPPPPPPQFERPQVEIPPPEVNISMPTESTTAITDVTTKSVPKAPPAPRSVVHAAAKFPNTEDYYPPASIRLEEQGSAIVKVCVGPNGKLAEPPSIEQSTNSARLDDAVLKLARAGHFTAGKVDGVATTDCIRTRVKFELKK